MTFLGSSEEFVSRGTVIRARAGQLAAGGKGLNNKLKVITRRAYGLRTLKATEIALYHALGGLLEPPVDHRFF